MAEILYKKGLELLKQRDQYPEFFDMLLLKLPPITKIFFTYYNTGDWKTMYGDGEIIILPNIGVCGVAINRWFEDMIFDGKEYEDFFSYILPINEILSEFSQLESQTEKWHRQGMIKIGMMGQWDIILLGVGENNQDQIFVYGEGISAGKIHKFCNNVFDMLSKVKQYLSDEDLKYYSKGKINTEDLYKNWGEDFWRVRGG